MNAIQIVSSSWFLPGYIGILLGLPLGCAATLIGQWIARLA